MDTQPPVVITLDAVVSEDKVDPEAGNVADIIKKINKLSDDPVANEGAILQAFKELYAAANETDSSEANPIIQLLDSVINVNKVKPEVKEEVCRIFNKFSETDKNNLKQIAPTMFDILLAECGSGSAGGKRKSKRKMKNKRIQRKSKNTRKYVGGEIYATVSAPILAPVGLTIVAAAVVLYLPIGLARVVSGNDFFPKN